MLTQDQEDAELYNDRNVVPFNTLSIRISQQRSLLSILNIMVENTGVYKCSGHTNQGVVSSVLVFIKVGKF